MSTGEQCFVCPIGRENGEIVKAEAKCLIFSDRSDDSIPAVRKIYRHRGPANFIREKILWFRAEREYRILVHLTACGISCSRPLNWTYGYCREFGFYEILSTRQIPAAVCLREFLSCSSNLKDTIDLGPLFHTVLRMHNCGVYHGALSTKNILVVFRIDGVPEYYLVDLASGWLFARSIRTKRIARYDLFKLVKNLEAALGTGFCRPYLAQYGLSSKTIDNFYRDLAPYRSLSRKQRRIKNWLKIRIFLSALLGRLDLRGAGVKHFSTQSTVIPGWSSLPIWRISR